MNNNIANLFYRLIQIQNLMMEPRAKTLYHSTMTNMVSCCYLVKTFTSCCFKFFKLIS